MIDRAEKTGFGASIAGHALLFGLLFAGYTLAPPINLPERSAIEVDLVAETALESGAPQISNEAPAPRLSEVEAPPVPEPPRPTPVDVPKPVARSTAPAKAARPESKVQPRPVRSGGNLKGLLDGLPVEDSAGRSAKAPGAKITPQVQSSLASAVRRQLKPHWKAPTGADAELLRTELSITLARDGSVIDIDVLGQKGITPSNRGQAALHREQAIKAVRLASPFQLPPEFYEAWKLLSPIGFDKRLSQ